MRRIEQMRKAGELATKGGDPKSKPRTLVLSDLLDKRAKQRASEWAMLLGVPLPPAPAWRPRVRL
jgi:hypothetical protein